MPDHRKRVKRTQATRRANDRHMSRQHSDESVKLDMCSCPGCGLTQRARLAWEQSQSEGGPGWTLNAYCPTCGHWIRRFSTSRRSVKAMAMRRGLDWRGR